MNDAHSGRPYAEGGPEHGQDPYAQPYYDAYGQPQHQPQPQQAYSYDEYGRPYHDPYAQPQPQPQASRPQAPAPSQQQGYDGYGGYDPYAQPAPPQHRPQPAQPQPGPPQQQPAPPRQQPRYAPRQTHQQAPPRVDEQQGWIPQQPYDPYDTGVRERTQQQPYVPQQGGPRERDAGPRQRGEDYRTEQFSFIEEEDAESEDVIDWLKFAETRSERRDERKRKGRNRVVALILALVLALVGAAGYLWWAGKLPALPGTEAGSSAASGPQKRDVIVVHLRETRGGGSSTALLVDNETTGKGATVLLPNTLALSTDDGGSTTLGKAVADEGTTSTRDALDTLLGAQIKGSWRLDTPYLENLVELVGGIEIDADTTVPGAKKGEEPLVKPGRGQTLGGQAAVAYATHLGRGEPRAKQLERFGQVMHGVLRKLSSDPDAATTTVQTLNQIPDPSLTEAQLGASLAGLAERAKDGSYDTAVLPVEGDGTLSEATAKSMVKDVLGGTVKNADPDAAPRVSVRNASGDKKAASNAQVALLNSGYTLVGGGTAPAAQSASQVTYADAAQAAKAKEVAKTLGLPDSAVAKGRGAANADVTVVLGRDYEG
ncbi:LCP family protein [Streptomyces pathocidini]|uniref:LCP family protein n=1 Tax=Streptomyces pathocidini TaxID=1650571 RepID=UPI0033F840A7